MYSKLPSQMMTDNITAARDTRVYGLRAIPASIFYELAVCIANHKTQDEIQVLKNSVPENNPTIPLSFTKNIVIKKGEGENQLLYKQQEFVEEVREIAIEIVSHIDLILKILSVNCFDKHNFMKTIKDINSMSPYTKSIYDKIASGCIKPLKDYEYSPSFRFQFQISPYNPSTKQINIVLEH